MRETEQIVCANHPKIEAVTKCEICGKALCIACKEVYHEKSGVGDRRDRRRTEICRDCIATKKQSNKKKALIGLPIMLIIMIVSVILILTLFSSMSQPPNFPGLP